MTFQKLHLHGYAETFYNLHILGGPNGVKFHGDLLLTFS